MDEQGGKHSTKMDSTDLESVRIAHGDSVARYLTHCNIVQKTASGAFVISPRECFDKLRELVTNETDAVCKENLKHASENVTLVKTMRKRKFTIVEHENDRKCKRMLLKGTMELAKGTSKDTAVLEKSLKDLSITIQRTYNFTKLKQKPPAPTLKFSHSIKWRSKGHVSGKQLYELMMKTYTGTQVTPDYKDCINDIDLILTEFQTRHENYRYNNLLQRILKEKCYKLPKDQFGVTLGEYQLFVFKVIAGVVPKALFGCNKNVKILRKILKAYYLSPSKTQLDLRQSILSFDISRIPWLQKIKNTNTQWLVIAKVTKWLFENFFMRLFKAVFREQKSLYSDKRIIMSAQMWINFRRNYIVREVSEGRVAKSDLDDDCRMTDIPSGKMIMHPKLPGVRTICKLRRTEYQEKELNILRILLQQLYRRKYETMNHKKLHTTWLSYAKESEEDMNRKVNVVACDVANAFGSIIQKKLFDIVSSMIDEIPNDNVPLQWYEILLPRSKNGKHTTQFKQWFSCYPATINPLNLSLVAISKRAGHEVLYVPKEHIRSKLAAYIFEQIIVYRHQEYVLTEGIIQGSTLSPILSEIYYQQMMIQEFGSFMQSGTILRYVDDYIYMTMHEDCAKRFLNAIRKYIPEYNCRFKKTKIQSNVEKRACRSSEWVDYLGYQLNGETMEIRPKYERQEFQYAQYMKRIALKNSWAILKKYLKNIACLKLNRIILDPRINSLSRICANARLAAHLLATRCAIFIRTIFYNPSNHRNAILTVIKKEVKRVELLFCQYLTAIDCAKWPNFRRTLKIAIWQSFFRVFTRYRELREPFGRFMKVMIQNQSIR